MNSSDDAIIKILAAVMTELGEVSSRVEAMRVVLEARGQVPHDEYLRELEKQRGEFVRSAEDIQKALKDAGALDMLAKFQGKPQ